MSTSQRRFILRERTSEAHAAVDGAIGSFRSLDTYKHYLRGMSAFRRPLEAQMAQIDWPSHLAFRTDPIGALIDDDMDDLGMAPVPAAERPQNIGPEDLNWLLGTLYVLEGSTLGAQILIKRAGDLGLGADFGARHLARQATGIARWRDFISLLETAEPLDMDRTTQASIAAFAAAERAFKGAYDGSH